MTKLPASIFVACVGVCAAAQARTIIMLTPTGTPNCNLTGSGATFFACTPLESAFGAGGISFSTVGPAQLTGFMAGAASNAIDINGFANFTGAIPLGGILPVQYSFNLSSPDSIITGWTLKMSWSVVDQATHIGVMLGSVQFQGSSGGALTGSGLLADTAQTVNQAPGLQILLDSLLTVSWTAPNAGHLSLDVPAATSYDFVGTTTTGTPEPATLCMVSVAILIFLWWIARSPRSTGLSRDMRLGRMKRSLDSAPEPEF